MRGNVILVLGSILLAGTVALTGLSYFAPVLPYASSPRAAEPTAVPAAAEKSFLLPETYGSAGAQTMPANQTAKTAAQLDALNRQLDQVEASRKSGAVSFKPGEPMIDPQPR